MYQCLRPWRCPSSGSFPVTGGRAHVDCVLIVRCITSGQTQRRTGHIYLRTGTKGHGHLRGTGVCEHVQED